MATLLWMQTSGCSGDTMAILCAEKPTFHEAMTNYGIRLLWHPSLSPESPHELGRMIEQICADELELTVLAVEGAIAMGPDGSGMFDTFLGEAKKDVIARLADKAQAVVAVGTCAGFGGISAMTPNPTDAVGLQWVKASQGGLLPADWKSRAGLPVINVAGCPSHPSATIQTLLALGMGAPMELDSLNRPVDHFTTHVHNGCTRNEFHEYNVEDSEFGGDACLFFNLGCRGPVTKGICNTDLWNGESSKTRVGAPCVGCTSPTFPDDRDFLKTSKLGPVPKTLPLGVERSAYMSYKGLARRAAPQRLLHTDDE